MSTAESCKKCGSSKLVVNSGTGDTVCEQCGVVQDSSVIVTELEFETNSKGLTTVVGQFVTGATKFSVTHDANGVLKRRYLDANEYAVYKAKKEIERIGSLLKVSDHSKESAQRLHKQLRDRHFTQGRRSSFVCASCLYISCRLERSPHVLADFSQVLGVKLNALGRVFTAIKLELSICLPLLDPCLYVIRYANQMNLGVLTREISKTALRILNRMKKDSLNCGRQPLSLCAAALTLAARLYGFVMRKGDIMRVFRLPNETIFKRIVEFRRTPASALTIEEFMTTDVKESLYPPSYSDPSGKLVEQKWPDFMTEYLNGTQEPPSNGVKRRQVSLNTDNLQKCTLEAIIDLILHENDRDSPNMKANRLTVAIFEQVCGRRLLKNEKRKIRSLIKNARAAQRTKLLSKETELLNRSVQITTDEMDGSKDSTPSTVEQTEMTKVNKEEKLSGDEELDDSEIDQYIVKKEEFSRSRSNWKRLGSDHPVNKKIKVKEQFDFVKEYPARKTYSRKTKKRDIANIVIPELEDVKPPVKFNITDDSVQEQQVGLSCIANNTSVVDPNNVESNEQPDTTNQVEGLSCIANSTSVVDPNNVESNGQLDTTNQGLENESDIDDEDEENTMSLFEKFRQENMR